MISSRNLWVCALLFTLVVASIPAMATPSPGGRVGGEGQVNTGDVEGTSDGTPQPCQDASTTLVDRCIHEPSNNDCGGAIAWPLRPLATSTGSLGPLDISDWSVLEIYRTETVGADVGGNDAVTVQQASDCNADLLEVNSVYAGSNGVDYLRVATAAGVTSTLYSLTYTIAANDALTGGDVGNTFANAYAINALPESANPQQPVIFSGSLPAREDPLKTNGAPLLDQDWYRVHANLALVPGGLEGPTIGLLTVSFSPDCNGGTYRMRLYQADGSTPIGPQTLGCGSPNTRSCIATGLAPVYAKLEVLDGSGTGYDVSADLSPVHIVNLDDGVERVFLSPTEPWCENITPMLLNLVGDNLGLANSEGEIIATVGES